jgi:multidrug efflux pump subunit AcrA (membrane-fusion protein)
LRAKIVLQSNQLAQTEIRAPAGGVIVTSRIDERVGQFLPRGSEFCVIADVRNVTAEVAVPESDSALVRAGENVNLKLNSYPTRVFRGSVTRVGSHVREEGTERFVIAEVRVENGNAPLKTGMLGKAKVSTRAVPMIAAIFRKPLRYIWTKLWPLLP